MKKTAVGLSLALLGALLALACQNRSLSPETAAVLPDKAHLIYDLPFDQQDYQGANRYRLQALGDLTPTAVTADSELSGFVKVRAIDTDLATQWASGIYRAPTAWLRVDLGSSKSISSVALKTGPTATGCQYDIEVSTDGTTFTPVLRNLTNTTWNLESKSLPSGTTGRYVRIFWRNNPTTPANRFAIYELVVRGELTATSAPSATPTPLPTATPPLPSPSATGMASQYYPNLQARAATGIWMQLANGNRSIRFANTIPNKGASHFQVRGDNSSGTTTQAYQEVIDDAGRVYERRFVGAFEYHPTHNHMHLDSVARYQLRVGSPTGTKVAESSKVSFCMMDSVKYYPGAPASRYGGCNDSLQGITRFWGDVYGSSLDGQSLPVDGLASGIYYIVTIYDPLNKFIDTDRSDDVAWTKINLDMTNFKASVLGSSN